MIHASVFGGLGPAKERRPSTDATYVVPKVLPEFGAAASVRQVFSHFQNLNLRVLKEAEEAFAASGGKH